MKSTILTMALTGIMSTVGLTVSAQQADKKSENARKEVAEDQKKLAEAKKDSVSDYQKFKKESEAKIQKNETAIAALKTKKANDNKEVQEKYNKNVADLEQKNNDLRVKMQNCNGEDKGAWASFKHGFNEDMDKLGKSISKMTKK